MLPTIKKMMKKYRLNEEEARKAIDRYKKFIKQRKNTDDDDLKFSIDEILDIIEYDDLYGFLASKNAYDEVFDGTRDYMETKFPGKYFTVEEDDDWDDAVYDFAVEHNLKYDIYGYRVLGDEVPKKSRKKIEALRRSYLNSLHRLEEM